MSYWTAFFLRLALGVLVGLLVGMAVEGASGVQGWGVLAACVGGVVGLLIHMWRT